MNRLTTLCCAVALTVFSLAQCASACEPTEDDAIDAIAFAASSLAAAGADWDDADSYLGNLTDAVELYGTYNDHLDNGDADPDAQLEADIEANIAFGQSAIDFASTGADETSTAIDRLIDALDAWDAGNYQDAIDDADLSDQASLNASMEIGNYGGDLSMMEISNADLADVIAEWASGGGCP